MPGQKVHLPLAYITRAVAKVQDASKLTDCMCSYPARVAAAGAVEERGDITRLPATAAAAAGLIPVIATAPLAADADKALRPVRGPTVLAEALPPFGEPSLEPGPVAADPTAATPDSMSFGDAGAWVVVRGLRCCASVCCRRLLTTSSGLVGELSTASFTLHTSTATVALGKGRQRYQLR
jgi:hypothetical protein